MPRFDFVCDDCGKELIDFVKGMYEKNPVCPVMSCNGSQMRKLFPRVTLKTVYGTNSKN